MTGAICFKCRAEKSGALTQCGSCKATPRVESELALSLVFSEHLMPRAHLEVLAHELHSHLEDSDLEGLLRQAREALKDPQLLATLEARSQSAREKVDARPASRDEPSPARVQHQRNFQRSHLRQNPFAVLGATTRDDRRRIIDLADGKSLELDHAACQKARSDLTNPRTRLSAEMSWLPGVSPKKVAQFVSALHLDPMSIRAESSLPTLPHLNLLAAAFEAVDDNDSAGDIAEFIQEMAHLVEDLSAEQILRDINEDRLVSGFPEVKGIGQVEAELSERKRYYRRAIKDALDRLPPDSLVAAVTLAVDSITCGGENHAPELIDELVDSYAVDTQGFLQKEDENVQKLINAARDAAKSGERAVRPFIDKLEVVARNWDKVAQPIQLSAKARGISHEPSCKIAYSIRSLAVELYNAHNMLAQSQRLTRLSQDIFAELPVVAELVEQDSEALADIFQAQKEAEARKSEWARDINYRAEVGVIFKNILSISTDGLTWKNQHFPLDAVTRVRWGAIRHSVNGIPTGTSYGIAFGDKLSEAVVELRKESTYSTFVDKLWKAVVVRLLAELLETLRAGKEVRFGDAILRDDGVTLIKHKFWGANESIRCSWGQVRIWVGEGAFCIGAMDNKKTYASLSYIHVPNVHILEQVIRTAFKKPGLQRLSDLLQ